MFRRSSSKNTKSLRKKRNNPSFDTATALIQATGIEKSFGTLKVLKGIDFSASDREVVKVHREEVAPVIEMFRDASASMDVPTAKRETSDYIFGLFTAAATGCRVVEREEPRTPRSVRIAISDLMTNSPDSRILPRP